MIPIKQDGVTRLVPETTRVVDLLKQYGRMPVYRKTPARRSADDKPADHQERLNSKRLAAYAQRLQGVKPALLQLWCAP
ncbi:MAG: hypothetical protein CME80_08275 [Halomonas sp.]|nr:hypothetical protein [Halomonas sp.]MBF57699.1 hypothetical protein [Halomonas sp.]|tara:strand:+ start:245 stop:481 length:237 start_codon:yes stop_codon:yes gene_type:complete